MLFPLIHEHCEGMPAGLNGDLNPGKKPGFKFSFTQHFACVDSKKSQQTLQLYVIHFNITFTLWVASICWDLQMIELTIGICPPLRLTYLNSLLLFR